MNDIIQLALPIHPNTSAGQALYNAQIMQWNAQYTGQQVNKTQPYPHSPGTAPAASGECWKCGMLRHMSPSCKISAQIPGLEARWRSITMSIKHSCPPTAMGSINYVNKITPWGSKEEYDQQLITDYLASQGKGQGLSV
jgi:hypothetical protein